jgi:hypothetical protein
MLELALKAKLPLVQVQTDDPLNLIPVIEHLTGDEVAEVGDAVASQLKKEGAEVIVATGVGDSYERLYEEAANLQITVIFCSDDYLSDCLFDAGQVPVPQDMVVSLLKQIVHDDMIPDLLKVFGGVSLKDVAEIARLTMAQTGSLTPRGVMGIRRELMGNRRGLTPVNVDSPYYQKEASTTEWVEMNRQFFLEDGLDPRLIPRGILATGVPGTGKTELAKYVAREWGVPLYHLEVGSMMGKWVGESEANLKAGLARLDREEPCVVLIDEVEKVFSHKDDSGVAIRMMSQLLWWMQEHRSRVFTVMTTNDIKALPPELYREGRIDTICEMNGLATIIEAVAFLQHVLSSFEHPDEVSKDFLEKKLELCYSKDTHTYVHAKITQLAYDLIKGGA